MAYTQTTSDNARPPDTLKTWAVGAVDCDMAVLTIVFTDITGSTLLYDLWGEEQMLLRLDKHFARVEELTKAHRGYLVKNLGDGFMVAFHAVPPAVDFVLELRANTGDEMVKIHAGVDVGPLSIRHNDAYGGACNYAGRLLKYAAGEQVIISDSVKAHLEAWRATRHQMLNWEKRMPILKGFGRRRIFILTNVE